MEENQKDRILKDEKGIKAFLLRTGAKLSDALSQIDKVGIRIGGIELEVGGIANRKDKGKLEELEGKIMELAEQENLTEEDVIALIKSEYMERLLQQASARRCTYMCGAFLRKSCKIEKEKINLLHEILEGWRLISCGGSQDKNLQESCNYKENIYYKEIKGKLYEYDLEHYRELEDGIELYFDCDVEYDEELIRKFALLLNNILGDEIFLEFDIYG